MLKKVPSVKALISRVLMGDESVPFPDLKGTKMDFRGAKMAAGAPSPMSPVLPGLA